MTKLLMLTGSLIVTCMCIAVLCAIRNGYSVREALENAGYAIIIILAVVMLILSAILTVGLIACWR